MKLNRLFVAVMASVFVVPGLSFATHHKTIGKGDMTPFKPSGFPITTSPYLGVQSRFDGSDLLVNVPSTLEDVRMLKYRQKGQDALGNLHEAPAPHPFLKVSGKAEGQLIGSRNFAGNYNSDVDLASAELNVLAAMNSWVTGFIAIDYDGAGAASGRVNNSRLFLRKGFITVGNLDSSPFFFTLGQTYVPFGRYSSAMVSAPLTMVLARTRVRNAQIGYDNEKLGLTGQVYAYRPDNNNSARNDRVSAGGAALSEQFSLQGLSVDLGAGYITNITNSGGMEQTGGAFGGFTTGNTNPLVHDVPAVDGYLTLQAYNFDFIGEYVTAVRRFDTTNLTFNGQAAKPMAFHAELGYSFKVFNKPTNVAVGYGQTSQSLALNLPQRRYTAVINTSLYHDTIQSLEFRHDRNYSNSTATGDVNTVTTTGKPFSNTLTLQFGIYF